MYMWVSLFEHVMSTMFKNRYVILRYSANCLKNNFAALPSISCLSLQCCSYFASKTINRREHFRIRSTSKCSFLSNVLEISNFNLKCEFPRSYSKKKKTGVPVDESDEEDVDDNIHEDVPDQDELDQGYKIITKNVPSLRFDSVLKTGLGSSKKAVEKDFYAGKVRLNGHRVPKKSIPIGEGDELDHIKGLCPENENLLVVNRVLVKSVGNITGSGNFPVTLHLHKSLIIENYEDKWP